MIQIKQCSLDDVIKQPNFNSLVSEYREESGMSDLPSPSFNASYKLMEQSGFMHPICSFNDNKITGFLNLLVNIIPHYGVPIATTESFFVSKKHRKGGTGLKLLNYAENLAKRLGASACLISAPYGSRLDKVLARSSYNRSNVVYSKKL